MGSKRRTRPEQALLAELRERLTQIRELLPTLSRPSANKTVAELVAIMGDIDSARADADPIKDPGASFDPANPDTAGRLVALALIAQEKVPLDRIARTYGSGVYAIYYHGDHPAYAAVSNSETPLYVGKADPTDRNAKTPREQGPRLYGRLVDHRRMIKTVGQYALDNALSNPILAEDFTARRLVCATNAQLVAERHLIATFKPIWNNEIGICWGISKHGDSPEMRAHPRSPWDVMHPGRPWAMASTSDSSPVAEIEQAIDLHFKANPPYRQTIEIVDAFLAAFVQHAAMTAEETAQVDDALDEALADEAPSD